MSEPLGYLLTWTCYGTWLHGDRRGSVDPEHNAPGAELAPARPGREAVRKSQMRHAACVLGRRGRQVVRETIIAHCEIRGWTLHAVDVRSNHAHVVVSCDASPKTAMRQLKAWSTRRLREVGIRGTVEPAWAEGGSGRYLWTGDNLRRAIEYVGEYQGA